MKVTKIHAKGILNPVKQPDDWFGLKYNMNLYRGCQHRCIYCDSRSDCYQIEDFDGEVIVKINAVNLLADQLPRKRIKGTIGTGSMNDPYMPIEKHLNLTGLALGVIAENQFPVHVLTKSDLVLRDIDLLTQIAQTFAAVSFTITTADDELGKKLEPGAPKVTHRLKAMAQLAERGIHVGVLLMPLLPIIEDTPENVSAIFQLAADHGASYIIPSYGTTLRNGSRDHYYAQLDKLFPGMSDKYRRKFGSRYFAPPNNPKGLNDLTRELCQKHNISLSIPKFTPEKVVKKKSGQMEMF